MIRSPEEFLATVGGSWMTMAQVNVALRRHDRKVRAAWHVEAGRIAGVRVRSVLGAPNPGVDAVLRFPFRDEALSEASRVAEGLPPSGVSIS